MQTISILNGSANKHNIATHRVPDEIDGLVRHGSTPYDAYT